MKKYLSLFLIAFLSVSVFAQSDDDLFGGSDDDFFGDDGIVEVTEVAAKNDLSKGTLFEAGSVKVGGRFDTSLGTSTVIYADDDKDFGERVEDTTFNPTLSAFLSVDARPTDTLRMYTKFGLGYPFEDKATTTKKLEESPYMPGQYTESFTTTIQNWFTMKELFTDFSIADTAYFRFGLHTVTWGTGYFFSPVSDIINASSINPEDVDAQVDGVVNLRTQVTFPDSQNCLWAYVIPSTLKAKETAFAAKGDFVIGGWELGLGGYYKYENAPKAVLTASGSIKKFNIFGEMVYQYGAASEWEADTDWEDKKSIVQATAGVTYTFKTPEITLAAQYYYDGNDKDFKHEYFTYGHNAAALVSFGKILGNKNFSANLLGIVNFGKDDLPEMYQMMLDQMGMGNYVNTATFSGTVKYTGFTNLTLSMGPYVTFNAWDKDPVVSLKLTASLGGGKF